MTSRVLLAFALSLAILILYPMLFRPARPPRPAGAPPAGAPPEGGAEVERAERVEVPPAGADKPAPGEQRAAVAPQGDAEGSGEARPERPRERLEISDGQLLRVEADSRGGILSSVWLLGYFETVEDRAGGAPYQLVYPPEDGLGLLSLTIEGHPIPSTENWKLTRTADGSGVVLENEVGGMRIRKIVSPSREGKHEVGVRVEIENTTTSAQDVTYKLYGPAGLDSESQRRKGYDVILVAGQWGARGDVVTTDLSAAKLSNDEWIREEPPAWIGLANNYFTAILVAGSTDGKGGRGQASMSFAEAYPDWRSLDKIAEKLGKDTEQLTLEEREKAYKNARVGVRSGATSLGPGEKLSHDYVIFAGPRDTALLKEYDELRFAQVNRYSWIGVLIKLFISLLEILKTICVGSYGAAIVLLTLLVKLCLHPINRRSQKSMQRFQKKMQKVKPQMDELKERYSSDRMKMNQELQKLWREHGINPGQQMGGCLVLFLQLPIWWALYNTLQYAIGLRQASFLYIDDLTRPDHLLRLGIGFFGGYFEYLNLLPILYVILTLINQKLQPKPEDPQMQAQMRMMSFMMVAFGFIFYGFPSGFMLYIMTSSGLSIIESKIIKRELAHEEALGGGAAGVTGGGGPAPPRSYPAKSQRSEKPARPQKRKKRR